MPMSTIAVTASALYCTLQCTLHSTLHSTLLCSAHHLHYTLYTAPALKHIYTIRLLLTPPFCIYLAGNVCFLHVAISVRDLREQVMESLRQQPQKELVAAYIKIPTES